MGAARAEVGLILLAAGEGKRLQRSLRQGKQGAPSERKAWFRLGQRSFLRQCLDTFQQVPAMGELVVVAHRDDMDRARRLVGRVWRRSSARVVRGGRRRQDSMASGLGGMADSVSFVLVHDVARPLVAVSDVRALLRVVRRRGAAALAGPVADTVKTVDRTGRVLETLDRASLRAVQTPQGARRVWFEEAVRRAEAEGWEVTDDLQLLEKAGRNVHLVSSRHPNPKITTLPDLLLARRMHGGGA